MRLAWKADDRLGAKSRLMAPLQGHLRGQLTVDVEMGRSSLNCCGNKPKQSVRNPPGKEGFQREGRAKAGNPKPLAPSHT